MNAQTKRHDHEVRQEVIRQYTSGEVIQQIALNVGVSYGVVRRHLFESGIQIRARSEKRAQQLRGTKGTRYRKDIADADLIKMYVEDGLSCEKVARIVGLDPRSVNCRLRKHGVIRPKHLAMRSCRTPKNTLEQMYLSDNLTTQQIAEKLGCCERAVRRRMRDVGIKIRTRSEWYTIQRGRRNTSHDYVTVRLDNDDPMRPMANSKGFCLEHRLLVARHLGRCLERWELVHHKNHIRSDNRIENLEIKTCQIEHNAETFGHVELMKMKRRIAEQDATISDLTDRIQQMENELAILRPLRIMPESIAW